MRWFYAGPIECPNCHSPISDDTAICPYCSTFAPMSAPWQLIRWQVAGMVLCFLAGVWLCDQLAGTQLLSELLRFVSSSAK